MQALADQAVTFGDGRIDIWINNAGVGAVSDFEETPLDAREEVLQTDMLGYLRGAYVVWPYFKAQKTPRFVQYPFTRELGRITLFRSLQGQQIRSARLQRQPHLPRNHVHGGPPPRRSDLASMPRSPLARSVQRTSLG